MLHGTQVIQVNRLSHRSPTLYICLALFLWCGNLACVIGLNHLGCPRSVAALALIPMLAAFSYLAQKHAVFFQRYLF